MASAGPWSWYIITLSPSPSGLGLQVPFIMPKDYHVRSSTCRLKSRADRVRKRPFCKMRRCASCIRWDDECQVDRSVSEKCGPCLRNSRFCELSSNEAELDRKIRKRNELEEKLIESMSKTARLRKQIEAQERQIRELGFQEAKNIEEIAEEEQSSNEVPFLPPMSESDLDRLLSEFPVDAQTVVSSSHNS